MMKKKLYPSGSSNFSAIALKNPANIFDGGRVIKVANLKCSKLLVISLLWVQA